jgi:hypothetical protein
MVNKDIRINIYIKINPSLFSKFSILRLFTTKPYKSHLTQIVKLSEKNLCFYFCKNILMDHRFEADFEQNRSISSDSHGNKKIRFPGIVDSINKLQDNVLSLVFKFRKYFLNNKFRLLNYLFTDLLKGKI